MRGSQPPRPTGSTTKAHFDQWVWDRLAALKFFDSSTVKWRSGTNGFTAYSDGQSGAATGILAGPFQIDSVQGDYLTCYAYNPSTNTRTGTTPIYIAKEDKQQNSLTTETIFGVVHNYTYQAGTAPPGGLNVADAGNVFRTDAYGGATEYQRIVPPWVYGAAGEIVWANQANTGVTGPGGVAVVLQIAGRSCQWGVANS